MKNGLTRLAQSSLPFQFWEHAFHTATFIHKRTITAVLNYESPYQKLFLKISDYDFIKTYGCLYYPMLRP